jgi:Aldehyde dehydrogenase family
VPPASIQESRLVSPRKPGTERSAPDTIQAIYRSVAERDEAIDDRCERFAEVRVVVIGERRKAHRHRQVRGTDIGGVNAGDGQDLVDALDGLERLDHRDAGDLLVGRLQVAEAMADDAGLVPGHSDEGCCRGAAEPLKHGGCIGGNWFEPTILADVEQSSEIVQQEVFGPVLTLQTFRTEDEAVQLANGTYYGLAATILTGDEARAERVASKLVAGTVWTNCFYVRDLAAPFGGSRKSGVGREGGAWSFDFFCDVKNIAARRGSFTS